MTGENSMSEAELKEAEERAERQEALPDDLMSEEQLAEAEELAERQAALPDFEIQLMRRALAEAIKTLAMTAEQQQQSDVALSLIADLKAQRWDGLIATCNAMSHSFGVETAH